MAVERCEAELRCLSTDSVISIGSDREKKLEKSLNMCSRVAAGGEKPGMCVDKNGILLNCVRIQ